MSPTETDSDRTISALVERIRWQNDVFAVSPKRSNLSKLGSNWPLRPVSVHVVRNHPFEFVASALPAFLAYAGLSATFSFGPYDDSLSDPAGGIDADCSAVVVWIDPGHYAPSLSTVELAAWLAERVAMVRSRTTAPVLAANWADGAERAQEFNREFAEKLKWLPGVYLCNLDAIRDSLGESFIDDRLAGISGATLSDRAMVRTAQEFGLRWLPAVLSAPIKAIVVDFDDTLYAGTLGEVGAAGLEIGEGYTRLHDVLLQQKERGIFLAGASRNDPADVDRLFADRPDLKLAIQDFSVLEVGWHHKSDSIRQIADSLRIGVDAILFVDDNPAQIAETAVHCHGLHCLVATDPDSTTRAIEYYPGLFRFSTTDTAALRIDDLAAADLRGEQLRAASDRSPTTAIEYLESLGTEFTLFVNPVTEVERLADMSARFNQFNTTLLRLSEAQVAAYVHDDDKCVVAIRLRDRLSDSGLIAALFAHAEAGVAVIDEIDISCRALGRGVDDRLLLEGLNAVATQLGTMSVQIEFRAGPKNDLARDTLRSFVSAEIPASGRVAWSIDADCAASIVDRSPVSVRLREVGV